MNDLSWTYLLLANHCIVVDNIRYLGYLISLFLKIFILSPLAPPKSQPKDKVGNYDVEDQNDKQDCARHRDDPSRCSVGTT